jgi:hypothetical protein
MKPGVLAAVSLLGLAGCAGMDADACRGADWYGIGFRDAIFGMQPQDDLYATQCQRHGERLDAARYATGWREGNYEFQQRKSQSGVD